MQWQPNREAMQPPQVRVKRKATAMSSEIVLASKAREGSLQCMAFSVRLRSVDEGGLWLHLAQCMGASRESDG